MKKHSEINIEEKNPKNRAAESGYVNLIGGFFGFMGIQCFLINSKNWLCGIDYSKSTAAFFDGLLKAIANP